MVVFLKGSGVYSGMFTIIKIDMAVKSGELIQIFVDILCRINYNESI